MKALSTVELLAAVAVDDEVAEFDKILAKVPLEVEFCAFSSAACCCSCCLRSAWSCKKESSRVCCTYGWDKNDVVINYISNFKLDINETNI